MRRFLQPLLMCLVAALAAGCSGISRDEIHAALAVSLDSAAPEFLPEDSWELVQSIYADADGEALWVGGKSPRKRARTLVETVASAEDQGLRTADYDFEGLEASLRRTYREGDPEAAELAELDLRLTALYLDFGRHLLSGRLDPSKVARGWFIRTRRAEVDSALRRAAGAEDLERQLSEFTPSQPDYELLAETRARYALAAENGGFPKVPGPLVVGDSGSGFRALVARLAIDGELDSTSAPRAYDSTVAIAVKRFRLRYGLPAEGGLDKAAVAAMNVPAERRIRQLELNMERLRWLPNDFGTRYVAVNIPDFELRAYDEGRPVLSMRVIVGDEYDGSTPVFSDTMNQVVFRPYWNVPAGIALNEIVPLVRKDESYLTRNRYEVLPRGGREPLDPDDVDWDDLDSTNFEYLIRQQPGPANALGLVKFLFPNRFDIYMHDTPGAHLFRNRSRALSHGCIRLEHPDRFAAFVLKGQDGWTEDRIEAAMKAEETRTVALDQPLPVYIFYLTAFARDDRVHFRPDLYDLDAEGIKRLGQAPPAERIAALRATLDELMKG